MTGRGPVILISAGEVSGDIIGAQVAAALLRAEPGVTLFGLGGRRMAAAGVQVPDPGTEIGVVGVSEVMRVLPAACRAAGAIARRVRRDPPDVAVLIGNDLFNAALARWLRRRGIPTIAYSPPQVWVWRALLRGMSAGFARVLASFPEEAHEYRRAGVPTTFVGHYLADTLQEAGPEARAEARRTLGIAGEGPVVAILPGSRRHEIERLGPTLFAAARRLVERDQRTRIVVAAVDGFTRQIAAQMDACGVRGILTPRSHTVLRAADAAICCSGTATLEAALLGVPMAVVYRTSWTTDAAVRACTFRGLDTVTIALPNLVLGRHVVPELKQHRLTPAAVADEVGRLLVDPRRRALMREGLREVRALIDGRGAIDRVAHAVLAHCGTLVSRRVA